MSEGGTNNRAAFTRNVAQISAHKEGSLVENQPDSHSSRIWNFWAKNDKASFAPD